MNLESRLSRLNTKLARLGIKCYREQDNEDKENLVYHIPESDQPEEVVHAVSTHATKNHMSNQMQIRTSQEYAEKLYNVANRLQEIAEEQTKEIEDNSPISGIAGLTTAVGAGYFLTPEFAEWGQQFSQYLGDNTTIQSLFGAPVRALTTWGLSAGAVLGGFVGVGELTESAIKPLRYDKHTDNDYAYFNFQTAASRLTKDYTR